MARELVKNIDVSTANVVLNIEGSHEKYCIVTPDGLEYVKFGDSKKESFAEVLASSIARRAGVNCVKYGFVREIDSNGAVRAGTISQDYSSGSLFRVSLASVMEKVATIDRGSLTDYIYCELPTAIKSISTFGNMKGNITYNKESEQQISSDLTNQVIADYFCCNSDHHTRNTELLIMPNGNGNKMVVAPLFDLGNTFRSSQAHMALSMPTGKDEKSQDLQSVYTENMLEYFKNKNLPPQELAEDTNFGVFCNFLNMDIRTEIYAMLNNAVGNHNYASCKFDKESYELLMEGVLDKFNETTNLGLNMNNIMDVTNIFESRQTMAMEMIEQDEQLALAYLLNSEIMQQSQGAAAEPEQ